MRTGRRCLGLFFGLFLGVLATADAAEVPATRIALIDAEIFGVDRSHSHLGFTIGFLGMTTVRGTFNDYAATILYDELHPERSSVTLVIDSTSIDTNNQGRDKDLQAEAFFDAARHPTMTFQSTRIENKGNERYLVHGELTMKGVTKPVAIPMTRTVPRTADSGWGNIRIGGIGSVALNRREFGIDGPEFWSRALADTVHVEIDLLGSRPNYDRWSFQSRTKPSIGEVLASTLAASGAAAAAAQFRELFQEKPDQYNFDVGQFGIVVNRLIQHGRFDEALVLLAAAAEAWPEQAVIHARIGEARAARGDRVGAIAAYEKVLALHPEGTEAREMLKRLKPASPKR